MELRDLIEKEHTAMGEGDFAGMRRSPAADQPRNGDRVMRSPKRTRRDETGVRGQKSCDTPDRRDFESFVHGERRKNTRQTPSEHRLAGAGRPDEQHVVIGFRITSPCRWCASDGLP